MQLPEKECFGDRVLRSIQASFFYTKRTQEVPALSFNRGVPAGGSPQSLQSHSGSLAGRLDSGQIQRTRFGIALERPQPSRLQQQLRLVIGRRNVRQRGAS